MRAVICEGFGPPPVLKIDQLPRPILQSGHVRIQVHACGLGFPDTLIISGQYQIKHIPPFIPGFEISGIITEVAPDVRQLKVGDRVLAITEGGLAEEAMVPVCRVTIMRVEMDLITGAAFLLNYGTSYHALVQRAKLQPNETLLVLGASGGVGLSAVDIGHALGAKVITAVGSQEKLVVTRQLGTFDEINYASGNLQAAVAEIVGERGVDVIYDAVGGVVSESALATIAWEGRYLVIGFASGIIPKVPLSLIQIRGCSISGVFWGAHLEKEAEEHFFNFETLFKLYAERKLNPRFTVVAGLESAPKALYALSDRKHRGKVVVRIV